MKYRSAAFLIVSAIVWYPVHAQPAPAVVPFAAGITIDGYSGAGAAFLARQGNGEYIGLLQDLTSPYSFGPANDVAQLLATTTVKNFFAFPAGAAGIGRQSGVFALADLDNNGLAGFALFSNIAGPDDSVTVYQGNSGLSAFIPVNYAIGPDVNSAAFADFNGDGYPDLAVAYSGGIAILLNKGNGVFGSPMTYASGIPVNRFAVLDLNHDGALDIAAVSFDGMIVLLGTGTGNFGSPAQYTVGGSGEAIAIADFNGDGVPDIVAGTALLVGNGNGTFSVGPPLPVGTAIIWAFAAGDLDGDGIMDLVYADTENQFVVPLFGRGDGSFTTGPGYAVSQFPDSLVIADYNNDGRLDIINGNGDARGFGAADQSGNIDLLLNNGGRTFQGVPEYLPPQYGFLQASGAGGAVAKFGGVFPGVLASSSNGDLTLFTGNGTGGFQPPQNFTIPPALAGSSGYAGAIAAGDFNGDGLPDAAVITSGGVAILLANAGGFGTPNIISLASPAALVSADFDGDGKADLVVMSAGAGDMSSPGSLAFLKGNGNGTFGAPVTIPAGFSPAFVYAVDLNGDGKLDLVFADSGYTAGGNADVGGAIYVSLNAGGGVFQAPVQVFSGTLPTFGIGDVNGDGKLDLIASSDSATGGAVINFLQGNGNGSFQPPISIATEDANGNSIVVEDFNGDGNLDIVIAHQDGETGFLAGYGNGTFSAETSFNSTYEPTLLLTADLNGDGKPDVIALGFSMAVLLNDSEPPTTIQTNPAGLQFSVDGGAAQTAPRTLSLSQGPHTIAVTTPQAGAAAGAQYSFKSWSDAGALSHSIMVGAMATTYTATFTTQYELTISASPPGDGTVTPATGAFYDSGTMVPVTATAGSGDTFTGWTGSVASASSSSTTVTMSARETVTANFSGGGGHPTFFSGEDSLGAGVYYLQFPDNSLFGYYNYPASSVIYHYDMGFEAFVSSTAGQIYFYDFASGHWWYTSSSLFPYLYDFTLNTFIYYFPDTKNMGHYTTNPRYFSNLTTGKIFTM